MQVLFLVGDVTHNKTIASGTFQNISSVGSASRPVVLGKKRIFGKQKDSETEYNVPADVEWSHEDFLDEVGPPFRKLHFGVTLPSRGVRILLRLQEP